MDNDDESEPKSDSGSGDKNRDCKDGKGIENCSLYTILLSNKSRIDQHHHMWLRTKENFYIGSNFILYGITYIVKEVHHSYYDRSIFVKLEYNNDNWDRNELIIKINPDDYDISKKFIIERDYHD